MLKRWIPWNFIIKRAARAYGVIDPITLLARLRRFAQPSEIQEPIELLRAGIIFHARGLVNTRAIQHNLDWIWPYWVERQFNPRDPAFIPRGFSFTHTNLTHRNWTAVGLPNIPVYPIIDPRGLVTPLHDGWSLDFWIIPEGGKRLIPSRLDSAGQAQENSGNIKVSTECRHEGEVLYTSAMVKLEEGRPWLEVKVDGRSEKGGFLAAVLRPYNPEGIQFIERIEFDPTLPGWRVNGGTPVSMDAAPERVLFSTYQEGDVAQKLAEASREKSVSCDVGMATSAALFPISPGGGKDLRIRIPLEIDPPGTYAPPLSEPLTWETALSGSAILKIPDPHLKLLYDTAVRTLVLLSAGEIVPGPYTYRRFWFRDACFMINALLCVGMKGISRRHLAAFPRRQKYSGYFQSQEGEWDSNGQVLWIFDRYQRLTGSPLEPEWITSILKGAEWLRNKRIKTGKGEKHFGLLPPGFSAEHFGPNDYYYWDDFWGVAGLRGAARISGLIGEKEKEKTLLRESLDFEKAIFTSIFRLPERNRLRGIPASPYRRMDSGAIGSLAADYPLQLTPPGDPAIMATVEFLLKNCMQSGGFFQDMIHSGVNPYLTLAIAQTLLRKGDPRYRDLIENVARLASPTGQWPEAIHPNTGGGCMGDGQHGWSAAEWVMMIRNLFVREEGEKLVIGAGIFPEWLDVREDVSFGPAPTPYGALEVRIEKCGGNLFLHLDASWRAETPVLEVRIPGYSAEEKRGGDPIRLLPATI